jgi:hypothetical protein
MRLVLALLALAAACTPDAPGAPVDGGVDVGEAEVLLRGEPLVDVAEVGERVVVGDVGRLLAHRLPRTEKVVVHRAG